MKKYAFKVYSKNGDDVFKYESSKLARARAFWCENQNRFIDCTTAIYVAGVCVNRVPTENTLKACKFETTTVYVGEASKVDAVVTPEDAKPSEVND